MTGNQDGVYYQPMTAYATEANGYPAGSGAGHLIVWQNNANGGTGCRQEYYPFSNVDVWYLRTYQANTNQWTAWQPMVRPRNDDTFRSHIGLGSRNSPTFGHLYLSQSSADVKSASGIVNGDKYNADGVLEHGYRIYSEVRNDNKAWLTIHLHKGAKGSETHRYLGFREDGVLDCPKYMQVGDLTGQLTNWGLGEWIRSSGAERGFWGSKKAAKMVIWDGGMDESGNGTATLAFAIKNNQAFLKDAFIENGTISSAKIAQEISSNNYDSNGYHNYGWYINKNGHAQFMDVWVKGNINASSGNFTGAVNATSGTFRGDVYANNGSFRGTIDATGGTFRGRVEASVIRANQFEGAIVAHRTYGDCAPVYNSQQRVCRWRWRYVDNVSGQGKNVTFFFKLNGTLASSQLNAWIAGHQILAGKKYFNDNNGMCAVGITGLGEQTIDIVIEIYTPWSTSSVTGVTISCPTVIVSRSNSSFQGPWNESHD